MSSGNKELKKKKTVKESFGSIGNFFGETGKNIQNSTKNVSNIKNIDLTKRVTKTIMKVL